MILSLIKCNICLEKHFEFKDEIKKKDSINLYNKECNHFSMYLSVSIKKEMFEKCILSLKCKSCEDMHNQIFSGYLNQPYEYQCPNCKVATIFFNYKLSNKNEKIYNTPKIINDDNNKKRINIRIFYDFKPYNFVFNADDKIEDKYDDIRKKMNFPYGKKIFFNYKEVDMTKTFEENNIINEMKLEIQD